MLPSGNSVRACRAAQGPTPLQSMICRDHNPIINNEVPILVPCMNEYIIAVDNNAGFR